MTKRNPNAQRAKCGMTHAEIRDRATDTHKHCSRCGQFKPLEDFNKSKAGFKGRTSECRQCWSKYVSAWNRTEVAKLSRKEYLHREEQQRAARLRLVRRRYGEDAMHLEERRLAGDPCDACGSNEHVGIDHCHKGTGNRGLLCRNCNLALGYVDDDPARLRALAAYLEVIRDGGEKRNGP